MGDGYDSLRGLVALAYETVIPAWQSLPTVDGLPMSGWDGAQQLQIVRYA